MLLWAILVFYLWRERGVLPALKTDRARAVLVTGPFVLLWMWGCISYQRHFSGWTQDYARRVALPGQTLLATQPVPRRGGYLFTAMVPRGYSVFDQSGGEITPREATDAWSDELSATARGQMALVEVALKGGSQLMAVPVPMPEMAAMLEHLENAESPVISPDGAWIAYLHEELGRGSLWVMHTQGGQAGATLLELVGRSGNVQDAAFLPSGDLLFTATVDGRRGIYTMPPTRSHGPVTFLVEDLPVSSPAVSPDGRWIAFRKQVHSRWQLVEMDLATHTQRMLTGGDCDAYAPAWLDRNTIIYATDCGRAVGMTALAKVRVDAP
jgi:hypothetical protein